MIRNLILLTLLVSLFIAKSSTDVFSQTLYSASQKKYIDTLIIEGVNIWVRSEPKTGEVIMKLNSGDKCYVLAKGEKQSIRNNTDYWYKIDYQSKEGWVFGSQTSLKQHENLYNQKYLPFKEYIKAFILEYFTGKDFDEMIVRYQEEPLAFIHPEIGFARFYNPGVMCGPYDYKANFSGKVQVENNFSVYPNEIPDNGFCEESSSPDGVYYTYVNNFPFYYDITDEGFEKEIEWPYPDNYKESRIVVVKILKNAWISKTMYFIEADGFWWLAIINDCDCSA